MWIFAMFDLPVHTKEARRRYARFRKRLLEAGFTMMQYSVYARYCANEEVTRRQQKLVREAIPPDGYVRVLAITDRQFAKMESYIGKCPTTVEQAPKQLTLF